MLKKLLILPALCTVIGYNAAAGSAKGAEKSDGHVMLHSFRAFPAASARQEWEKVRNIPANRETVNTVFKTAAEAMNTPVPPCSAIKFMEYNRTGNRINYEMEYFTRRARLQALVLAEALEHKGRYTDKIIEYLWAVADEYTWAIPAHTAQRDVLPFFEKEEIDLFSAETANTIAQTLTIMEPELAAVSPNLVKRLKKQLMTRSIIPVEENLESYWWRNLTSNWNPWICSNLLWTANTVLADDPVRLTKFAGKLIKVTDRYYRAYMNDGGSEEGAMYWTVSPVTYFLFQEALYRMSDGKVSRFGEDKFKKMCEFITAPQCGADEFVTFADAPKNLIRPAGICRVMAERLNSDALRRFAAAPRVIVNVPRTTYGGLDTLFSLFYPVPEVKNADSDFLMVYPELEQLFCRRGDAFFAVKAGNNGENHGHLDAGQFVFRRNGKFLVLDLGAEEYSKNTFNQNRFKSFVMNSAGHNPLMFNGIGQGIGKKFAARDFSWREEPDRLTVSMELAGCYPAELKLKSCRRTLIFEKETLTVRDEYTAETELTPQAVFFSEIKNPLLRSTVPAAYEKFTLHDNKLKSSWGDSLTRIRSTGVPAKSAVLEWTFGIQ